jgi:hypothetical protein
MTTASVPGDDSSEQIIHVDPAARPRPRARGVWLVPALVAAAFAGVLTWTASFPGPPMIGVGLLLLLGSGVLYVAPGIWLAGFGSNGRRGRDLVVGVLGLALVLGSVVLAVTGVPLRVRFAASERAFEAVVAQANRPSSQIRCPSRIGAFELDGCSANADGDYLFLQRWSAFTDDSGILYLPNGPSAWAGEEPRHLGGPWYAWTCNC